MFRIMWKLGKRKSYFIFCFCMYQICHQLRVNQRKQFYSSNCLKVCRVKKMGEKNTKIIIIFTFLNLCNHIIVNTVF